MANTFFDNYFLSNEIEDQFNSHLALQNFVTVDNNLVGTPGMWRRINTYRATDGAENLTIGQGNTKAIEVSFSEEDYRILLVQNRFNYFDEEHMTDPMVVPTGMRHMGTDMFNWINNDIFTEFNKTTQTVTAGADSFDKIVQAIAAMNLENIEGLGAFGFITPADMANLRTEMKDTIQYVEAFARQGYVGTVAGVNLYTKKDATPGEMIVATREAVTLFNKRGVEVEQRRNPDTRQNSVWSRKYYIAALTDESKAVKITL